MEKIEELTIPSGEVDEEKGVPLNSPKEPALSAVTFDGGTIAGSTSSPGRRIHTRDVKNVFRASTTRAPASQEQIARIKRMHEKISDGVNWDFNYSCLLMVASIVAGLGLAIDSATTVISSMLLSPIM